jgi:hypothetical protein
MKMEPPSEFRIGGNTRIAKSTDDAYDGDPRGLIFLWEPPNPRARYVMGVDAAQGRTGWNRYTRIDDDTDTDNGAIEVIRLGRGEPGEEAFRPDYQVAEYAAPIDPYDLAKVANALGRMYGGKNEDGQALAIIEVYPGPGGPTQRSMMETYGYSNFYRWQFLDTGMPSEHSKFDYGWYSTKQSMQHLWTRGLRLIHRKQLIFKSPYLTEELADCEMDMVRQRGQAGSAAGKDDRATACLLALWAGHNWTFSTDNVKSRVEQGPIVEWQATDISSDRLIEAFDERWDELTSDVDQGSA